MYITVAHGCHGTSKNFTAQTKTSRHKHQLYGTNKNFTAQTKTSRHKHKLYGTNKDFTAQTKLSRRKLMSHRSSHERLLSCLKYGGISSESVELKGRICMLPIVLCVTWGWMTSGESFEYVYYEIWQVNSFYYVAKFSLVRLICFFERIF